MGELCTACLCPGRSLSYINNETVFDVYRQMLNEIAVYDITQVCVRLCWECVAVLHKFVRFKHRAQRAYSQLLMVLQRDIPEPDYNSISTLPRLQICDVININYPDIVSLVVKDECKNTFTAQTDVEVPVEIKTEPTASDPEQHSEPETFVKHLEMTEKPVRKKAKLTKKAKSRRKAKLKPKKRLKKKVKEKEKLTVKHFNTDEEDVKLADLKIPTNDDVKLADLEVPSDDNADFNDGDLETEEHKETIETVKSNIKSKEVEFKEITLTEEEVLKEREEAFKSEQFLKSPFKCDSCIIGFESWTLLGTHTENCHTKRAGPLTCPTCSCRFPTPASLAQHAAAHARRYACPHAACNARERTRELLVRHMRAHAGGRECELCGHVSESLSGHQAHMNKCHNERPQCVECGKIFSSTKTYRYHLNVLHKGQNRFPCPHCGKVYQWKSNLWRHIRNHKAQDTDELYCEPCDKRFASVATYRQHVRISRRHVTETQFNFTCHECGKKFVNKTKLKDHIDWEHLNKINYRCQLCNKPFKSNTSLYVHLQNVHRNKEEKDNLCHVCGKSYQSTAKLKYHIVAMHTGATPYTCSQCAAAFSWYSSLYRHVREVHDKMKVNKKSKRVKKESVPPPPLVQPPPLPAQTGPVS